jgi:uncharacterized lipoprotein YajG
MKKNVLVALFSLSILAGCAKPETPEQQIAKQYDPNKDVQVIQVHQSHGLIPDLVSGIFKK